MDRREIETGCTGTTDDEIDLYQLWAILVRRKMTIFVCLLVCLSAGLGYAFLKPVVFEYSTVVDLGSISGESPISMENALAILNDYAIPKTSEELLQKYGKRPPAVKISVPKKSQTFLLSSTGRPIDRDLIGELHRLIFAILQEETRPPKQSVRRELELKVANANLKLTELEDPRIYEIEEKKLSTEFLKAQQGLAALSDQEKYLLAQEKQIALTQKILEGQIAQGEKAMERMQKNFPEAANEADDESRAMTMLLLTNQIQQERNTLAALKERLSVTLDKEQQQLIKAKEELKRSREMQGLEIEQLKNQLVKFKLDLEREQQTQRHLISSLENQLNDIRDARMLGGGATQSRKPAGAGKRLIVGLAAVLGLMVGIMLAFLVEFFCQARVRQQKSTEPAT